MSDSSRDAKSVGVWIVAAAAVVGLLVLLLGGSPAAAQPMTPEALAALLAERAPRSADERVHAAETLLYEDLRQRSRRFAGALLDVGWRVSNGLSPRRALSSVGKLVKSARELMDGERAQERALLVLASAHSRGETNDRLDLLYADLLERERERRGDDLLELAEEALEDGHLHLARARAKRAHEIAPSEETTALLARLGAAADAKRRAKAASVRDWEVSLGMAMLLGDYDRALALDAEERDGSLAQGVARYLRGDARAGLDTFERLAEHDDQVGRTAHEWLDSPELNDSAAFERAERSYYFERTLGWIGGATLAGSGLDLSRSGYKAWQQTITPTNLAITTPLRLYRGWAPDQSALREAARGYLTVEPDGEHAEDARAWLAQLGPAPDVMEPGWDDGIFVLPRARTAYTGLTPRPVLVAREVVLSDDVRAGRAARAALGEAPALRLLLHRGPETPQLLPADEAGRLLERVARALEQRDATPHGHSSETVIDEIRRLASALDGGTRVRAEPWWPAGMSLRASLASTALTGEAADLGALAFERGEEGMSMHRGFGRSAYDCPDATVCVAAVRLFSGTIYGEFETADFQIGASTSFAGASIAVRLGQDGPGASLVLPIASWLHVQRWVPLEARVAVSLDGISFSPNSGY